MTVQAQPVAEVSKDDPHLVMLVHGIRTTADWYIEARDLLSAQGFKVGLALRRNRQPKGALSDSVAEMILRNPQTP